MTNRGNLLIILSVLNTLNLWILSKTNQEFITVNFYQNLSQMFALLGIVLMSWSLVLSTRLHFIENMFSGLDNSYIVHRFIGSLSFIMLINHPILLALKSLPLIAAAKTYFIPDLSNLPYALGIISLYTAILSFLFIAFIKLPYNIWKYSHKLMAVSFLIGSLHSLLIGSDIANFVVLKIWIGFFILIGSLSALYTLILYRFLAPKYEYILEKIERRLDYINLHLFPKNKKLTFKAGQFVFLSVKNNSRVSSESHPFSIASSPSDYHIRLSIKINGDYTLSLPELKTGDTLYLYGPYGKFGQNLKNSNRQIWIAGGVGVTPFLSLLYKKILNLDQNPVYFFYCVKDLEEAVFDQEINTLTQHNPSVRYYTWFSHTQGRIDAQKIQDTVSDFQNTIFLLCGPQSMMENLKNQLQKFGVQKNNIKYENFSLQ